MEKSAVVVSKKWNSPEIKVSLRVEGIEIEIKLDDFLESLVQEFGSPFAYMTLNGLRTGIQAASQKVISGMKAETAKVM